MLHQLVSSLPPSNSPTAVLVLPGRLLPSAKAFVANRSARQRRFNRAMYIPTPFNIEDASKLAAFIRQHSFATLITLDGTAPFASHLPMLFRPEDGPHGTLVSHMARANPQWKHFASGGEALVIFNGPHSYISPSWYETELAVPTWNYAVVHAYGTPTVFDDHERVISLLNETVRIYEASFEQPWPGELPEIFRDKLIGAIVAFEIPVSRIEGKFKLGQNRSPADLRGVYKALSSSQDGDSRALAQMMCTECTSLQNPSGSDSAAGEGR